MKLVLTKKTRLTLITAAAVRKEIKQFVSQKNQQHPTVTFLFQNVTKLVGWNYVAILSKHLDR